VLELKTVFSHISIIPSFFLFPYPLKSSSRESRENRIFHALLRIVPGLEPRILGSSEEELRIVADLVRAALLDKSRPDILIRNICKDPEGHLKCAVRRHEEPQGCTYRLDHSGRATS
jgi:hypothetical protein